MVRSEDEMLEFNKNLRKLSKLDDLDAKINRLENALIDLCDTKEHDFISGCDLWNILKKYRIVNK